MVIYKLLLAYHPLTTIGYVFMGLRQAPEMVYPVSWAMLKEYACEDCSLKQRPDVRRRAQLPRTFSFNHIVGLDFFCVKWQDQNIAIFNMTVRCRFHQLRALVKRLACHRNHKFQWNELPGGSSRGDCRWNPGRNTHFSGDLADLLEHLGALLWCSQDGDV